jgi:hypothetical protein
MPDAIEGALTAKGRDPVILQTFGWRLRNQFSVNEAYRRPKELVWLEDLRAYKGLYDPDVKIETNNSKVYPKITRSKVNIVLSRLHEMLFPDTDEKNWEVSPTPDPRLSKEIVKMIALSLVKEDPETGDVKIPTRDELNMAIERYAKERCENMAKVIDDQFTEMLYPEETKKVLRSGLLYGTGVMKGPITGRRTKRIWYPTATGDYEEKVEKEEVPIFRSVRLWDWYPDASVTEIENMEGSFERHIMTKHDLRQLMKRDDFYADMIQNYLEEKPWGNYVPKNWEVDLQVIEIEAGTGKVGSQSSLSSTSVTGDTDDQRSTNRQTGKKYEVLEYWGYVDGADLQACGVNIEDVKLEYAANVWLLGNNPIKIALYEKALDEYKVFYYEKDETSLWGEGLARVMRHSQISIAAGARMVLDNAACVSGDTVVYRNQKSIDRPSEITVRELWDTKHKHNSGLRRTKVRSVDEETGELFYNRIVDVYNKGVKPAYEVKTLHGYCIKATDDHRFMGDDGDWSELNNFCIGDNIAVNGRSEPLSKICIECGETISKEGALRCRKCASKIENSAWNMKQALQASASSEALLNTARQRWACQKDKKDFCERCNKKAETGIRLCIHHKDGNPYNNNPDNKITCCQPCHMAIHHRHDYFGQPRQHVYVDYDEIVSIEYVGDEEVFDLEVESPNHNFIANGFVVHNCVSGPQEEINIDLMVEGTDINSFYPRKLWYRRGRGVDAQYPAIREIQFDSHIPELLSIIEAFKQFGDEETTLPTWMIGQMVNNETAQATSGRLATITVSIKDVVRNFDTFTEGVIRDLYAWNMEFNPREDIKGDYLCKARGVSSLVMKEIRMQSLNQLNASLTPEQRDYVPEKEFVKEIFRAHDINITLRSEEEVRQLRQERQDSVEMKLAIEMQKAEIAYKKSQTMAQLTKAKEKNVIANKEAQTPPEIPEGTDPRLTEEEIALQQTERAGKEADMRRQEEAHQQQMRHAEDDHNTRKAIETTKTAHDVAIKEKTASHGMKMKEKMAEAAAKAKKTAQKESK